MRAIDSGLALCRRVNTGLVVYWTCDAELNAPFGALFEPIPELRLVEGPLPLHLRNARPRNLWQPALARRLRGLAWIDAQDCGELLRTGYDFERPLRAGDLYMSSFSRFYPNAERYRCFRPIAPLRERIAEETRGFDAFTVGVHIRRTDHAVATAESPLEAFVAAMEQQRALEARTRFYLASDSDEAKARIRAHFGERVVTGTQTATRGSPEGIQRALVELYALAQSSLILGSQGSSFSHTAAELTGIEERTVRAKPP
jgi:hypothetical protein